MPIRLFAALTVSLVLAGAPARAEQLTIYSGGAMQSGLSEAVRLWENERAERVSVTFMPMAPLTQQLADGLSSDIVVLTQENMIKAGQAGIVDKDSIVDAGRVAVGVAVHADAPAPNIATPEALKQTLLAAKSIVYVDPARGTSGAHVAKVLGQLGIADDVKDKTTLGEGGYVVAPVGRGEIELGIHQITEILPVPNVKLVGPLPKPLQSVTLYQAAIMMGSPRKAEAREFLAFLRSPAMRQVFAAKGFMEAPVAP